MAAFCYVASMPDFKVLSIVCVTFIASISLAAGKIETPSKERIALLKKVDEKYQKQHGIHLKLLKDVKFALLGNEKNYKGEAWLSNGKMRLEIQEPNQSLIVANNDYLWIESAAPKGFKDAKPQVIKAPLKGKRAKSQGLIQLLTGGGLLNHFRVSGTMTEKEGIVYFLQPKKQALEFKRAQLMVSPKKNNILKLRYWDEADNETSYTFTKTEFNQKLKDLLFAYTPPKNAELITY